jgi:hypothetical protein
MPKHSVGVGGLWIRIDDEKNERFDGAAPSLFKKLYLLHDSEEVLERSMAEIDDSCTDVVGDQPIKKSHLAAGVTDVGNRRNVRQIVGQLRAFVGQVECCHRTIIDDVEISEQSRNESLSNASKWGANDVERGGFAVMLGCALGHGASQPR